ncbi:MAG: hypothetical protein JXM79_14845 [Sedimentisphaerales bacterium]|nr:hypothetical protein [Sedimentisphaerales bacterium]
MVKNANWIDKRDKWLLNVKDLFDTIRMWSESQGWSVHEDEKTISEDHIGSYKAPTLVIQCPSGRIHIDPIGCNIIGAHGRVDILSFPSLNRLLLIRINGDWKIKTESRMDWPRAWSHEAFIDLVNSLTSVV